MGDLDTLVQVPSLRGSSGYDSLLEVTVVARSVTRPAANERADKITRWVAGPAGQRRKPKRAKVQTANVMWGIRYALSLENCLQAPPISVHVTGSMDTRSLRAKKALSVLGYGVWREKDKSSTVSFWIQVLTRSVRGQHLIF